MARFAALSNVIVWRNELGLRQPEATKAFVSLSLSRRAPPAEDLPGPLALGGDPEADGDPNLPAQSPIAGRSGGQCLTD